MPAIYFICILSTPVSGIIWNLIEFSLGAGFSLLGRWIFLNPDKFLKNLHADLATELPRFSSRIAQAFGLLATFVGVFTVVFSVLLSRLGERFLNVTLVFGFVLSVILSWLLLRKQTPKLG